MRRCQSVYGYTIITHNKETITKMQLFLFLCTVSCHRRMGGTCIESCAVCERNKEELSIAGVYGTNHNLSLHSETEEDDEVED